MLIYFSSCIDNSFLTHTQILTHSLFPITNELLKRPEISDPLLLVCKHGLGASDPRQNLISYSVAIDFNLELLSCLIASTSAVMETRVSFCFCVSARLGVGRELYVLFLVYINFFFFLFFLVFLSCLSVYVGVWCVSMYVYSNAGKMKERGETT